MSKICLITAQNVQMSPDSLRRRIVDFSAERNIGAFFPTASNVGLTECKEIIAHSSLLTFFLDYNTCARIFQPRRTLRVKFSRNFSKNCAFMLIFGFTGVKIQFCVENKIRDKSNARELR